MTEYLTEQEQVEQLKKWSKIYGIPALLGILAGAVIFYGWNHYKSSHLRTLTHASKIYDEMLTDRAQKNEAGTLAQAEKLISHYPSTPYGLISAMMVAEHAAIKKNYPEALKQLSWALEHSHEDSFKQIARLRMARVYIADQKPQDALDLLSTVDDESFGGLIDEVRGDAFLALHQVKEAKDAYQNALQELPNAEQMRPLLEMKLDNLAG